VLVAKPLPQAPVKLKAGVKEAEALEII